MEIFNIQSMKLNTYGKAMHREQQTGTTHISPFIPNKPLTDSVAIGEKSPVVKTYNHQGMWR